MATNYSANSSAVQAPSPAPAVNAQPIASLPDDTDGWTVANFYQSIKAAYDFLYFLAKIVGGTLSAKSMAFDGTGGAASTPPDGTCQVSTNIGATSTPTASPVRGALYRDLISFAVGHFTVDGSGNPSLAWGINIGSCAKAGSGIDGDMLINFENAAPGTDYVCIATPAVREGADYTCNSGAVSASQAFVTIFNAGAPTHCAFNLVVWSK